MADMTVRWTGEAISDTRRRKDTGEPVRYTLTIFNDGQASCSCPAFIMNGINNAKIAPEDKLRAYRCKHLLAAFVSLGGEPKVQPEPTTSNKKPRRKGKAEPKVQIKANDIGLDMDDFTPIARRD